MLLIYDILQVKGEKPPAPTLGLAPKRGEDEEGGEDVEDGGGEGGDEATPAVNLADLVPRNDIRYISCYFCFLIQLCSLLLL